MAKIIDGKAIAEKLQLEIKEENERIRSNDPSFCPGLAIVQVGDRPDSNVYIRNKLQAAEKIGVKARHMKLPKETNEITLINVIDQLNSDPTVDGIIVQLPLDTVETIDAEKCVNRIDPEKDVDGLTLLNAGRLARGELEGTIIPCTPRGCLILVESTGMMIS